MLIEVKKELEKFYKQRKPTNQKLDEVGTFLELYYH